MNDFAIWLEASGRKMSWLSERFGIPYRTIQDWKSGKGKCPAYVLNMIKEILDKPLAE